MSNRDLVKHMNSNKKEEKSMDMWHHWGLPMALRAWLSSRLNAFIGTSSHTGSTATVERLLAGLVTSALAVILGRLRAEPWREGMQDMLNSSGWTRTIMSAHSADCSVENLEPSIKRKLNCLQQLWPLNVSQFAMIICISSFLVY